MTAEFSTSPKWVRAVVAIPRTTRNRFLIAGGFAIALGLTIHALWGYEVHPVRHLVTPFFEEPLKFCYALLLLTLGRVVQLPGETWRRSALACIAVGTSFATFEHYSSYPSELAISFAFRICTHTSYMLAGLAASLNATRGAATRWIFVASGLHLANNVMANIPGAGTSRPFFVFGVMAVATGWLSWKRLTARAIVTV